MADFSLNDAIMDVLERYDINVDCYTDSKDRSYVDLRVYAPAGEDICFTVAMDPEDTDQSFVDGFSQYANEFDPDEYPLSNSLRQLLDSIKEFLNNVSCDLQKALAKTKELETPTEEEKADGDGLSLD